MWQSSTILLLIIMFSKIGSIDTATCYTKTYRIKGSKSCDFTLYLEDVGSQLDDIPKSVQQKFNIEGVNGKAGFTEEGTCNEIKMPCKCKMTVFKIMTAINKLCSLERVETMDKSVYFIIDIDKWKTAPATQSPDDDYEVDYTDEGLILEKMKCKARNPWDITVRRYITTVGRYHNETIIALGSTFPSHDILKKVIDKNKKYLLHFAQYRIIGKYYFELDENIGKTYRILMLNLLTTTTTPAPTQSAVEGVLSLASSDSFKFEPNIIFLMSITLLGILHNINFIS